MTIAEISTANLFYAFILFCRISSSFFFLPVISESFISSRIKLTFALAVTYMVYGLNSQPYPLPQSTIELFLIIISEVSIGICFGLMSKIILSAIYVAGHVISSSIGMSSASMFDPTQHDQGTAVGNMLNIIAMVLIMSLNLHIFIIDGVINSYQSLPIGSFFQYHNDFSEMITKSVVTSWNVGVRFAAPFLVSSILIYLGAGILARLMPQLQIFFLLLPAQVLVGFIMLIMVTSATLLWFIEEYKSIINQFMAF